MSIDDYIEKAKHKEYDARGGNSVCYFFGDVVLLYGYNNQIIDASKLVNEARKKGINVPKILDYKVGENQKSFILEERAKGMELHTNSKTYYKISKEDDILVVYGQYKTALKEYCNRLTRLAFAPQSHFDKFVKDYIFLENSLLMVDPSKPSNFFYDENEGFSFIDIGIGTKESKPDLDNIPLYIATNIISSYNGIDISENGKGYNSKYLRTVPSDIIEALTEASSILKAKMRESFLKNGFTEKQISLAFEKALWILDYIKDSKSDEEIIKDLLEKLEEVKDLNQTPLNESTLIW